MKDIIKLSTRKDVLDFVDAAWKSDFFKENKKVLYGSHNLIQAFSGRPRMFCKYTNPEIEHAHFYAWMNIIPLRDHYTNPVIHDLYLLHEYFHATYIGYGGVDQDWSDWKERIILNELYASCFSEVIVYQLIPGLREVSFPFEIWYDSIKDTLDELGDMAKNHFVIEKRLEAINNPKNKIEEDISFYRKSNNAWADIWKDRFHIVETVLANSVNLRREEQLDYILTKFSKFTTNDIPFEKEAIDFYNFLKNNK